MIYSNGLTIIMGTSLRLLCCHIGIIYITLITYQQLANIYLFYLDLYLRYTKTKQIHQIDNSQIDQHISVLEFQVKFFSTKAGTYYFEYCVIYIIFVVV